MAEIVSPKSRTVATILAAVAGVFGAHRFYVGRPLSAFCMLFTLGGFGIWAFVDLIIVAAGGFRDGEGHRVSNWNPEVDALLPIDTAANILDELDALRSDVAELQERMDFTERLLTSPERRHPAPDHSPTGRGDAS